MTDPRSRWQQDAIESFVRSERADRNFLVTACPAAGKTRMALGATRALMDAGVITSVIVVVPTSALCKQWHEEADAYGLDITASYTNSDGAFPADCHGAAVTYSTVASMPALWRHLTGRHRTLVILDEIHHCGDDAAWGQAIREAFEVASRRLLLSGTPFRTEGDPIPFVTYDDNGVSRPDHGLSYGQAVQDGIVRPVRFEVMNGTGEWVRAGNHGIATAANVDEDDQTDLLRVLYDAEGNWIPSIFTAANNELSRIREEMPDAGGLVIASSTLLADRYARIMGTVCGERVEVVHSNLPGDGDGKADPNSTIRRFRDSDARWIVAVAMISEGVDIPRLAVGVFAHTTKTEMWFRQITGRVIRSRGSTDDITATMFIPAIPKLRTMAEQIEEEVSIALRDALREANERYENEQRTLQLGLFESTFDFVPIGSSEANREQVIMRGDGIDDPELRRAEELQTLVGGSLTKAHVGDVARLLRVAGMAQPVATSPVVAPPRTATQDELRKAKRKLINSRVGRLVRLTDESVTYGKIHGELNKLFGDKLSTASNETLDKRIAQLEMWEYEWV